jgi:hypothetical protein
MEDELRKEFRIRNSGPFTLTPYPLTPTPLRMHAAKRHASAQRHRRTGPKCDRVFLSRVEISPSEFRIPNSEFSDSEFWILSEGRLLTPVSFSFPPPVPCVRWRPFLLNSK